MGIDFIVPQKKGKQHKEPLKKKHCGFPGCSKTFKGTGKSRYCVKHRHRKYRKIIDAKKINAKKIEEEILSPNQTIKHAYNDPIILMMKCKLPGCENKFEIKVFPSVFIYPKYCKDHRNEHKRNMFIYANSKKEV
jgi:hypothetical protein